jgi:hypothetical protein
MTIQARVHLAAAQYHNSLANGKRGCHGGNDTSWGAINFLTFSYDSLLFLGDFP